MVMQHYTTVHQIQSPRTTRLGPNWPKGSEISALHTDLSDYTRHKTRLTYFKILFFFFNVQLFFIQAVFLPSCCQIHHVPNLYEKQSGQVCLKIEEYTLISVWSDYSNFTDRKLRSSGVKDRRFNVQRSTNRRAAYTMGREHKFKV